MLFDGGCFAHIESTIRVLVWKDGEVELGIILRISIKAMAPLRGSFALLSFMRRMPGCRWINKRGEEKSEIKKWTQRKRDNRDRNNILSSFFSCLQPDQCEADEIHNRCLYIIRITDVASWQSVLLSLQRLTKEIRLGP